eukprot:COSAG05_NODE_12282_length_474_cov_1.173333_1_plen_41_part_01
MMAGTSYPFDAGLVLAKYLASRVVQVLYAELYVCTLATLYM